MSEPIAPVMTELNAPFWAAAAEGRLLLPQCVTTGRAFWPPSPISPFVSGGAMAWSPARGEGVLRAMVIYRRVFQKAFEPLLPYGVGLLELDEGPRLSAFIRSPDGEDAPKPGDRVRLSFVELLSDGPKVPALTRTA
jgi:uncharacterized OB-fold protein